MLAPMELNHLRYFYEVAKAGSFTSAARHLRVSQPSLSKTVALLEAREGVHLLERSKKGVSLTMLGKEVYQDCEQIFATVKEVQNKCQRTKEVCEGPLRFGASDHIANYFLSHKLVELRHQYPGVIPSIFVGTPNEILEMIRKRELEFGIFFTKIEAPDLIYQNLAQVPMAAVYRTKAKSKELPNTYIGSILKDYKKNPAQEVLDAIQKYPQTHFETNSQELQKRLCLAGGGTAILARFMVEEELKAKLLTELPLPKEKKAQMLLAKRKNHSFTLCAKNFLELVSKTG